MAGTAPRKSKGGSASARSTRTPKKQAAPHAESAEPAFVDPRLPGAELIKAGLKALGAHGEAVTRHNRVFEALLGIDPSAPKRPVKDLFKLPSFEDLFDDRVARALERLGMTQALAELRERLDAIDARVQRLERQARTPRASKR
jgi:hypothetical protein